MWVWLSCVLTALLPSAPLMACWVQEEICSESNDPVESDPSEVTDHVTLSQARSEFRRTQRLESHSQTSAPRALRTPPFRRVTTPVGGQGSRLGRSPPLHC